MIKAESAFGGAKVSVNGKVQDSAKAEKGFFRISRRFADGDVLSVHLPMDLRIETMPDNPQRIALLYGPIVLAADLQGRREVPVLKGSHEGLLNAVQPVSGQVLTFEGKKIGRLQQENGWAVQDIHLKPLYRVVDEVYSVYMDAFDEKQWETYIADYQTQQRLGRELEAKTVGVFRIGEMQPERDHNFEGEKTRTGQHIGRRWRDANDGGWFAFDMPVDPKVPNAIQVTYWGSETGPRAFDVLVNGTLIGTQTLQNDSPGSWFDRVYPIPPALTEGKDNVRIRFQGHPGNMSGGVYGCRTIRLDPAAAK